MQHTDVWTSAAHERYSNDTLFNMQRVSLSRASRTDRSCRLHRNPESRKFIRHQLLRKSAYTAAPNNDADASSINLPKLILTQVSVQTDVDIVNLLEQRVLIRSMLYFFLSHSKLLSRAINSNSGVWCGDMQSVLLQQPASALAPSGADFSKNALQFGKLLFADYSIVLLVIVLVL
jgi:hypothetical protein